MAVNRFTTCITLFIVCCIGMACNNHTPKKITKAFYYWKTNVGLSGFEQRKLDSFNCHKLYIRFFDVDWDAANNEPKPIAVNRFIQPLPQGFTVVPVVFITQEALNKTPENTMPGLAQHLTNLLYEKCVQAKITPAEIQLDCDWTVGSQHKYFRLLNLCKKQHFFMGKTLSCTIRLHQVNLPRANGIPPVNKGLLMCYNMGNLRLAGGNNTILDLAAAERYLRNVRSYPLPLDIALPLFSWCLLYDNQNRFTGILRDVQEADLKNTTFLNTGAKNVYTVAKDTVWRGYTLTKNETVRYEYCNVADLYQLAEFVADRVNNTSINLIFYHCDSTVLKKYNNYELEKIYNFFN
jgi:hypothetical protein